MTKAMLNQEHAQTIRKKKEHAQMIESMAPSMTAATTAKLPKPLLVIAQKTTVSGPLASLVVFRSDESPSTCAIRRLGAFHLRTPVFFFSVFLNRFQRC